MKIGCLAALAAFCAVNVATAQVTVIQVGDDKSGASAIEPGQTLAASWTQASAFDNVSVYATLSGDTSTFTAYLTNSLGPGTTAANEIASASFNKPFGDHTEVNLFNSLSLPAGTYYLVLSGTTMTVGWDYDTTPSVTTAGGVTNNGADASFDTSPSYPPGRSFATDGDAYLFRVTGTAVPEPAIAINLFLGGAILAGFFALRARSRRGQI